MEREKEIEKIKDMRISQLVMDLICPSDDCDKPESCTICRAERLDDKGYRKIQEGAVVLTKEECDSKVILDEDHFLRVLDNERENARKQTAGEILNDVSKHYGGSWLVALYKKYGLEVDNG